MVFIIDILQLWLITATMNHISAAMKACRYRRDLQRVCLLLISDF